jgi:hypothetical protein
VLSLGSSLLIARTVWPASPVGQAGGDLGETLGGVKGIGVMTRFAPLSVCFCLWLLLSAVAGCSRAGAPEPRATAYIVPYPRAEANAIYADLSRKLRAGDTSLDFTVLRLAYADSSSYRPSVQCGDRQAMFRALHEKRYRDALQAGEEMLDRCPLDLDAHLAVAVSSGELGNPGQAAFHRRIIEGLVQSILASGDGKSLKSAMTVIDVQEEYVALDALGLQPRGQGLLRKSGRYFDEVQTLDPRTNTSGVLYFNLDRPMRWANHQLGN